VPNTGTTLALARVAAGGARWWLTATRSGAERADGPAVLAAGAHRGTRCAPCGRYAQTASRENVDEVRCAHRPGGCAPRRAAEIATTGHRLPRRSGVARVALYLRHAGQPRHSTARSAPLETHPHHKLVAPGLWGPGAARLWGDEEHRACGQRAARSSTLSSRLSERSAGTARSEFRDGPQDRAPQCSRRVQRPTAPVKRRTRPPQAWGDATANTQAWGDATANQPQARGDTRATNSIDRLAPCFSTPSSAARSGPSAGRTCRRSATRTSSQ
jgi:hypothetical protein